MTYPKYTQPEKNGDISNNEEFEDGKLTIPQKDIQQISMI